MNIFGKFRLAYIEMRLMRVGYVHRNDLLSPLGISKPQATIDLRRYRTAYPDNVDYDPGPRQYTRRETFAMAAITDPELRPLLSATHAVNMALQEYIESLTPLTEIGAKIYKEFAAYDPRMPDEYPRGENHQEPLQVRNIPTRTPILDSYPSPSPLDPRPPSHSTDHPTPNTEHPPTN